MPMLDGVRVLSFNHFLLGPMAMQALGDLGADVIAVEPVDGAFQRKWGGADRRVDGETMLQVCANRNKRSLAIDLKAPESAAVLCRLIARADVLCENFRPGVADKLGFGYDAARAIKPDIVYAAASGFGPDGPYRDRPGQDLVIQALSGLAHITGARGSAPVPVGVSAADHHGAALLAMVLWPAQLAAQTPGADTDDDDNPGWDNATELSVVRTGGNAETQTLGFSNTLRVRGAAPRLRLRFDGVRSRTGDERYLTLPPGVRFPLGGTPENFETVVVRPPLDPDVEQYFLEGRYDRELGERFLWHAGASWDRNRDAGIRNRNMIFAGVGNTWADRESLALSTAYGFSYTTREEEETDGFKANRFAGLRINGDYRQQLGTITFRSASACSGSTSTSRPWRRPRSSRASRCAIRTAYRPAATNCSRPSSTAALPWIWAQADSARTGWIRY